MTSPNREIILGVGGGIAAYKSCDLLRRLQEQNFAVTVIPTPASLNFVGVATWEALSGRKVTTQVWEDVDQVRHISLASEATAILIAPATADLIARICAGRADDLLTNVVLATNAPIVIAPAMHPEMWNDPATVANIKVLQERGYKIIPPADGRLTGSDSGVGRLPETSELISAFKDALSIKNDLAGKKVLISAGGTREAIDPVRFIGNKSSGKQGYALAKAAHLRGAEVTLVAANTELADIDGVKTIHVVSASEMEQALSKDFPEADILIMSAAVADARPVSLSGEKIKKDKLSAIELTPTTDILTSLAAAARPGQVLVGFAAETADLLKNANAKLDAKKLHLLYVNDVTGGAIFGEDQTSGVLLSASGSQESVSQTSKDTLAQLILDKALSALS